MDAGEYNRNDGGAVASDLNLTMNHFVYAMLHTM